MTPEEMVDELTYRSYAYNRALSPWVTPEQWALVFGERTWEMEMKYADQHAVRLAGVGRA